MNAVVVRDSATLYTRVTKAQAVKLLSAGSMVALCPVGLRPGYPFAQHLPLYPLTEQELTTEGYDSVKEYLERRVRTFAWANCTDSETGRYVAYYRMEEIQ